MNKTAILVSLGLLVVSTAAAGDTSNAGAKGYVAAYDTDGVTVIDVKKCAPKGKYSYDYVRCGKAFREQMNRELCDARGKGNHKWLYRVGDSKSKTPNTARCK